MSGAANGGSELGPEDERELLAGEHVLGTLELAEAQAVAEQAHKDVALAAAIAAWHTRLAPLARLVPPVTPPAAVWDRIAKSTGTQQTRDAFPVPRWRTFWDNVALWRLTTGAGLAAAIALLVVMLARPPAAPPQVAALLPAGTATTVFLAEEVPGAGLHFHAVTSVSVAADKDLELWALPPGLTLPVSLGVIPTPVQNLIIMHPDVHLVQHTQLLVSLEPKGGSQTGRPTGPVLFSGALTN